MVVLIWFVETKNALERGLLYDERWIIKTCFHQLTVKYLHCLSDILRYMNNDIIFIDAYKVPLSGAVSLFQKIFSNWQKH